MFGGSARRGLGLRLCKYMGLIPSSPSDLRLRFTSFASSSSTTLRSAQRMHLPFMFCGALTVACPSATVTLAWPGPDAGSPL
ncbi:hypothetical protein GLYMA_08G271500v4 [Glycine max]|uniref:Uncharacterized protein n=1 Tax=Glycine max TaxID=3847 RepID=K7L976_SOYBN|nr:hypothetical protein JHK85_023166 [Glycine max]KAH1053316.1 hypothetical protein GYH30_022555 [Glycine max]KRH45434.1 hypothetical protein GLYMA_08G271500v4 [Glycine max]